MMSLEILRAVLGWSALLQLGLLFSWWLLFLRVHDAVYQTCSRWFKLTPEGFDTANYAAIGFYKVLVWAFFIIPWLVLHIIA